MRSRLLTLASLALAALPACVAQGAASTAPRPLVPDIAPPPAYYHAAGEIPEASSVVVEHIDSHVEVLRIHIPAHVPPALGSHTHALDEIEIVHFRPRPRGGTPRPLVLMSPILGNDMTLMPEFARGFTRLGYHAAVVMRKDFDFDPETILVDAETEFRMLVMRARQALDWLAARDEVDGARIATFGVSAGAIISACLAGVDPRPCAHVLVLAGGPLADVLVDTTESRFRDYVEQLRELEGWSDDRIRAELRRVLQTDPVRLAPRVRREDVLLFLARHDDSVPTRHGITLWRALGRPEIRILPFDHYKSFLLLPYIQAAANRFLRRRLGAP